MFSTEPARGKITPEYKAALMEHGLKPYYGDHASVVTVVVDVLADLP